MNIVGVNYCIDSAAAILIDGKRVAASTEERFSRQKHDASFPSKALSFCLKQAGATADDIDAFAFFWNPGRHIEPALAKMSGRFRHHAEFLYSFPNHIVQMLGQPGVEMVEQVLHLEGGRRVPVYFVDHHLAHAAGAYFSSPFHRAAVLTVDGYGERNATLIGRAEGNSIESVIRIDYPHSVGAFYAAFTQYLGFKANSGEGKVMGLASYGDNSLYEKVSELVTLTPRGFELDRSFFSYAMERTTRYSPKLVDLLGPARKPESKIEKRHQDIASALQLVTEDILLHLARIAREETGEVNLVISGGVALNCVANRRIQFESGFDKLFIQPPAGDAGTSLGAAMYVAHVVHDEPRDRGEYLDYLGFGSSAEEVEQVIKTSGAPHMKVDNIEQVAAACVARGKIVGWYQGRTEFGPRALGNRSIVADPRPAEMKDILNARVKFREPFRPFAPSCLEEACGDLFDCSTPSPFMLRVYDTLDDRLNDLASITHVDGGARVQTVTKAQNRKYYNLIREFGRLTGVDCVLNTSFNIRGEPIVNTVREALFCYFGTDMDYLAAGDYIVAKSQESLDEATKG